VPRTNPLPKIHLKIVNRKKRRRLLVVLLAIGLGALLGSIIGLLVNIHTLRSESAVQARQSAPILQKKLASSDFTNHLGISDHKNPRHTPTTRSNSDAHAEPSPSYQPELDFFPRRQGEWQGWLVNLGIRAPCSDHNICGLALACVSGLCGPCTEDWQCEDGEVCALDHCLRSGKAGCRSRDDCRAGEICLMNGAMLGLRGNAEVHTNCENPNDTAQTEKDPAPDRKPTVDSPAIFPPWDPRTLAKRLPHK